MGIINRQIFGAKFWTIAACILLGCGIVFIGVVLSRDLPEVEAEVTYTPEEKSLKIDWPKSGQGAIGLDDGVMLASFGSKKAQPIASLAKVITNLVVLEKKPLKGDGPTITLGKKDVEHYAETIAHSGSNLYVKKGEKITERQMLEATMLISANNIAESLAEWAFGSFAEYKTAAKAWLTKNGLNDTKIGSDASGLDPGTTSTPGDMIKLGQLVLENPTMAEIIKQPTADFPLEGRLANTNRLIADGYLGIKTGNSDQAQSCLLFAKKVKGETVIGVLMGQPFGSTFGSAEKVMASVAKNFTEIQIPAETKIGQYTLPWGGTVEVISGSTVSEKTLAGRDINITLNPLKPRSLTPQKVGDLKLGHKTSLLKTTKIVPQPSLGWRLQNLDKLVW